MKYTFTFVFNFLIFICVFAQPSQNIRGKVFDSETNYPLAGAKLFLFNADTTYKLFTGTDSTGMFVFKQVPVGKYLLKVRVFSYDEQQLTVEVNSGKETILQVPMQEMVTELKEVVVQTRKPGEPINEMGLISARQFSVEETNRYAGSRSDPARMASNFAGVQGADDSRNDIVVRGNSPLGVIWRVEGIDIPNPSHFAISGSSGGPVSVLNNKLLANSDFFMSAFPAEYGNSVSAIFDLKLRNGNFNTHEFTGQFGLLGTEFLAEGPMGKNNRASYLVMGRYSTLSMFQTFGIKIGTDAIPVYGDGAFKLNWRFKNGGSLSFFGIGGKSKISILVSDQKTYSEELYGESDRDQYFGSTMGVTGLNYKKTLNEKTYLSASVALSYEEQHAQHYFLIRSLESDQTTIRVDSIYPMMAYKFATVKTSAYVGINHKINRRHLLRFGLNADLYSMNMQDSALIHVTDSNFVHRWDYRGTAVLIQPFVQWKYRISENTDFTLGIHAQYFSLSNSFSYAEPRIAWKHKMKKNQAVFAGAGMHSVMQPLYIYSYNKFDAAGNKVYQNMNMDFTRSIHTGLGYEKAFAKSLNFRTEVYYQYLYNIPVTVDPSSFSMINMGSGFSRFFPDSLKNTGTGYNYGLELTMQKFFDKSFFLLATVTVYDSKYKGSDGILRNTSYNGTYVSNLLAGKEWKISKRQVLTTSFKITVAGGKRYGYVNVAASEAVNDLVYSDSLFNDRKFKDYFRADIKLAWKLNAQRVTHEIGLDLVNIFNTKNILGLTYSPNLKDPAAEPIALQYQLGFLPIFYYKIDFRFNRKNGNEY